MVVELAGRFQDKSFLPTFGDIANFCHFYQIDKPASKSRASAIPRVFKFIASMEADDVRIILDQGMFSGPSRLGPIADAIRRNGRASTLDLHDPHEVGVPRVPVGTPVTSTARSRGGRIRSGGPPSAPR